MKKKERQMTLVEELRKEASSLAYEGYDGTAATLYTAADIIEQQDEEIAELRGEMAARAERD
jgi:hypothetical protein